MSLGCLMAKGFRVFSATQNLARVTPILLSKFSSIRTNLGWLHTSMPASEKTQQIVEESTDVWHICHDTVVDGVRKRVITLIDVRRPDEINAYGIIPTGKNIPVEELEAALQLSDEDFEQKYNFPKPSSTGPPIVTYCRSGIRSERACKMFRQFNYNNVGNYLGSWNEWSEKHPEDVLVQPNSDRQS